MTQSIIKAIEMTAEMDGNRIGLEFFDRHKQEYDFFEKNETDNTQDQSETIPKSPFPDIPAEYTGHYRRKILGT